MDLTTAATITYLLIHVCPIADGIGINSIPMHDVRALAATVKSLDDFNARDAMIMRRIGKEPTPIKDEDMGVTVKITTDGCK